MGTWDTIFSTAVEVRMPIQVFHAMLLERIHKRNEILYSFASKNFREHEGVHEYLITHGGNLRVSDEDRHGSLEFFYCFGEDGFAFVEENKYSAEMSIRVEMSSHLLQDFVAIKSYIKNLTAETNKSGQVKLLSYDSGFYLAPLGTFVTPFERGNYAPAVGQMYDEIVEDLQSSISFGRLTLIEGPAGAGKTYLLRSIISAVNALFVYVPASIMGELTTPAIMPELLREKKDNSIIFILEDADAALSTRQMDNISKLSDLLNMTDGILADLVDIRVIATTNAKTHDFDQAIMRSGRLGKHVILDLLNPSQCNEIFTRLTNKSAENRFLPGTKGIPLSDVYKAALEAGWKPEKTVLIPSASSSYDSYC